MSIAQLSVDQAADQLGVSPQRVRQRIHDGRLPAARIGSQWVVDELDLSRRPRTSRPMSSRIAWGFAVLLDGHRPAGVSPRELSRLRRRAAALVSACGRRDEVLSSWLASRASVHRYSVADADVADLRRDQRVALSGVSADRAELSAAGEAEGYVTSDQLHALEREYLLVSKPDRGPVPANVIFRKVDPPITAPVEVPRLIVIVDLIDRRESRASDAAGRLLDEVLRERPWMP